MMCRSLLDVVSPVPRTTTTLVPARWDAFIAKGQKHTYRTGFAGLHMRHPQKVVTPLHAEQSRFLSRTSLQEPSLAFSIVQ